MQKAYASYQFTLGRFSELLPAFAGPAGWLLGGPELQHEQVGGGGHAHWKSPRRRIGLA